MSGVTYPKVFLSLLLANLPTFLGSLVFSLSYSNPILFPNSPSGPCCFFLIYVVPVISLQQVTNSSVSHIAEPSIHLLIFRVFLVINIIQAHIFPSIEIQLGFSSTHGMMYTIPHSFFFTLRHGSTLPLVNCFSLKFVTSFYGIASQLVPGHMYSSPK